MPRQAKLGKRGNYWFTKAGAANGVYFGRHDEVSRKDALKAFRTHLASLADKPKSKPAAVMTFAELAEKFVTYVEAHRSRRLYLERKLHTSRFASFNLDGGLVGDLPAVDVRANHLRGFLDALRTSKKRKYDPWTIAKHDTSIRACFRWGTLQPSAPDKTYLPMGYAPFVSVEKYSRPIDADLASHEELPTAMEVTAILKHADDDIGPYVAGRRWAARPECERRTGADNPYRGYADLLRVFHETGARTGELAAALVKNFHADRGAIVLAKHKTSTTTKMPKPRVIVLGKVSRAIVESACRGRKPDEPIFVNYAARDAADGGDQWSVFTMVSRFQQVRKNAGVRSSLTIYSFRHLWISDAIMAGTDIATVAKMAGTSVAMIERVYGHLATDHLADAQAKIASRRSRRA